MPEQYEFKTFISFGEFEVYFLNKTQIGSITNVSSFAFKEFPQKMFNNQTLCVYLINKWMSFSIIAIIRISQSNSLALLIYFVIIKAASHIPQTFPITMGQACVIGIPIDGIYCELIKYKVNSVPVPINDIG